MIDGPARAAERRGRVSADPQDQARTIRDRVRTGALDPDVLDLAAYGGDLGALAAIGCPPGNRHGWRWNEPTGTDILNQREAWSGVGSDPVKWVRDLERWEALGVARELADPLDRALRRAFVELACAVQRERLPAWRRAHVWSQRIAAWPAGYGHALDVPERVEVAAREALALGHPVPAPMRPGAVLELMQRAPWVLAPLTIAGVNAGGPIGWSAVLLAAVTSTEPEQATASGLEASRVVRRVEAMALAAVALAYA